ncbi:MAG: ankyrin repeat domain-containing protein [Bermanella sp.]
MNTYLSFRFYLIRVLLLLFTVMGLSACSSLSSHIQDGDMVSVKRLIAEGVEVNGGPLAVAAAKNNIEAIKLLLEAGADINESEALHSSIRTNSANAFKYLLEAGANADGTSGQTLAPLHFSAIYYPHFIGELLEYGADVNIQNKWGLTALMYTARFQLEGKGLKVLLEAGADLSVAIYDNKTARMWAIDYDNHVVISILRGHQSDQADWQMAKATHTEQAYKNYLKKHDVSSHKKEANLKIAEIQAARGAVKIAKQAKKEVQQKRELTSLKKQSRCKLKEKNWVYTSGSCSGRYGHGMGKAVTVAGLSFEGRFKNGYRTSGKMLVNNVLMYDGAIQKGKPHGTGVCMHKGEPEDCNYYYGKRTDVLFKQRIEFAEQRKIMLDQQKSLDEKLARLGSGSGGSGTGAMGLVTNAAKKKATDEAVDYLFNQLF